MIPEQNVAQGAAPQEQSSGGKMKRGRSVRVLLYIAGVAILAGAGGLVAYRLHVLEKRVAEAEWSHLSWVLSQSDSINADVGSIQFLHHARVSITLSSVQYEANGIHLVGAVGNPTWLWMSNVTLNFRAHKPVWSLRQDYLKRADDDIWWGPPEIGKAQASTISSLRPGGTMPFDVTIPNVKQDSKESSAVIDVWMSGERYSYSP